MWSATIVGKDDNGTTLTVGVSFTDGTQTRIEPFDVTGATYDSLISRIQSRIAVLNANDLILVQVADVEKTPIPVAAPATPPAPKQDEIDRATFITDNNALKAMQKAIEQGLKKDSDQDYLDLQVKVKTEFKPEYSPLL